MQPGAAGPCAPVAPLAPCGPWGPRGPVAPVAPFAPAGPIAPVAPRDGLPVSLEPRNQFPFEPMVGVVPLAPAAPRAPASPFGPCGPWTPCGPVAPVAPPRARRALRPLYAAHVSPFSDGRGPGGAAHVDVSGRGVQVHVVDKRGRDPGPGEDRCGRRGARDAGAGVPVAAALTGRSRGALGACGPGRAGGALDALHALRSLRAGRSRRTPGAGVPLVALGALERALLNPRHGAMPRSCRPCPWKRPRRRRRARRSPAAPPCRT